MNKNSGPQSEPCKVNWVWHLFLPVAGLLILSAVLCDSSFVARYLSSDGILTEDTKNGLILLRVILLILAGACTVLWLLRKIITRSRDWRTMVQRWSESPADLKPGDLLPTLPHTINVMICVLLALWGTFSNINLHRRAALLASLTRENGVLETITVICYVFAAILALWLALTHLRHCALPGLKRWWLLVMAAGFLLIACEEIDWGQRYFHYRTPEIIEKVNIQNQFSMHNLHIPGIGRYCNKLHWLLTALMGTLLPLLLVVSRPFRRLMWALEVPLPPWIVQAVCYFAAAIVPRDHDLRYQFATGNVVSELREFTVAIAVFIWLWAIWQSGQQAVKPLNKHVETYMLKT